MSVECPLPWTFLWFVEKGPGAGDPAITALPLLYKRGPLDKPANLAKSAPHSGYFKYAYPKVLTCSVILPRHARHS